MNFLRETGSGNSALIWYPPLPPSFFSLCNMANHRVSALLHVLVCVIFVFCADNLVFSKPVATDDQPEIQPTRPATEAAYPTTNNSNPFSRISNYFKQWRDSRTRSQQERRLASFTRACVDGSTGKLDSFISPSRRHAPIDINMVVDSTGNGFTCLIQASLIGKHELVDHLLERGGK